MTRDGLLRLGPSCPTTGLSVTPTSLPSDGQAATKGLLERPKGPRKVGGR